MIRLNSETETFLKQRIRDPVQVALILGSGLNPLVDTLHPEISIPYDEIPDFPSPTVQGHKGTLHVAKVRGLSIALFEGRLHYYEGLPLNKVVYPVRVAHALGAETLVVTNAAGGIHPALNPGDFMLIWDHINLMGNTPLVGISPENGSDHFQDMSEAYSRELRNMARGVFERSGIRCFEGVLAAVTGPCYETPAEIQMMKVMGADAVCMSTIPEVIMANALGMRVLGISLITNRAAGMQEMPLDHNDVIRMGEERVPLFSSLIHEVFSCLGKGKS
ncbi:MAG: purine-nucleoside phosphorylase [Candidatus Hydrothermarchaeaceae archaeon]